MRAAGISDFKSVASDEIENNCFRRAAGLKRSTFGVNEAVANTRPTCPTLVTAATPQARSKAGAAQRTTAHAVEFSKGVLRPTSVVTARSSDCAMNARNPATEVFICQASSRIMASAARLEASSRLRAI